MSPPSRICVWEKWPEDGGEGAVEAVDRLYVLNCFLQVL